MWTGLLSVPTYKTREYFWEERQGKVDRVLANQSLLLGGYTVSLPTFPLLGFPDTRMNVTARHRVLHQVVVCLRWVYGIYDCHSGYLSKKA